MSNKDFNSFIEQQEAAGQKSLVQSAKMPKQGDWETLKSWGVQRLNDVDKLFCLCTLPEGWSKRPMGDTSFWSELVDETGTVKATIFYKAAFYDKDAFFNIVKSES